MKNGQNSGMDKLRRFNENALIVGIIATIIVITLQVISRTFFSKSFSWVEEVGRALFVYFIFGGAALAYKQGLFISADFISNFLPKKVNAILSLIMDLITVIFFIVVAILGYNLFTASKGQLTPALEVEIRWIYLAFPIFFAQMAYFAVMNIISRFRSKSDAEGGRSWL